MKKSPEQVRKILAVIHISILMIAKLLAPWVNYFGRAIFLAFVWYHVLKGRKWASHVLKVCLLLEMALGVFCVAYFFAYLYHHYAFSLVPCLVGLCMGAYSPVVWVILGKTFRQNSSKSKKSNR